MSSIIMRAGVVLAGALLLLSAGCSQERTSGSGVLINPDTGKHAPQWGTLAVHGAAAKGAVSSTTGFSVCQGCHSTDFSGGMSTITCLNMMGCHGAGVMAPHSPKPWRGGMMTHTDTDSSNAPVCAQCHTNGANSSVHPSPFDPAASPGCFNGTLCHYVPGHADPATWSPPSGHGTSAKAAPNVATMSGFSTCQICHGSDFSGGISAVICYSCHGGTAPHPISWATPTGTYTHTTTDPGNAAVCALCHTNGAISPITPPSPPAPPGTTPGCFNNTLCHGAAGHPAGWSLPTAHGVSAKAAPNSLTMSGFSSCQPCHGTAFTGGVSTIVCSACHGGSAPHPGLGSWATPTGTYTHTTTDQGNATVCALCHTAGANSPIAPPSPPAPAGTAPGCFNSTLCHANVGHPAGWALPTAHGANAKLAPNSATPSGFSVCQTCHGTTFTGGTSGQTCLNTVGCHGAGILSPHPSPWISGTYTHTNTNTSNASVCYLCHANGTNSPISPPSPTPAPGTAPGCTNGTLCHYSP